jgi:hypothetical protein
VAAFAACSERALNSAGELAWGPPLQSSRRSAGAVGLHAASKIQNAGLSIAVPRKPLQRGAAPARQSTKAC